ncbi:non-specific lipid transfer protein GPI-anchored 8-like [Dioscorea cayenensis subsp. rotundata]|uniref:Non-specific lipid transfer protein GPI-anchored 8-like n=1 Tax=Dioscorea cayennensis subsp. rotundata TaxID=55577 RepID=A0AB40BMG8_DIOCR|nr:non-specific lipid transfer protein GPI-anchored 8-like [Dioscorea cayenensis subsp. rotundata]
MASSKLFMNGVTMLVLFSTFACKSHGVELKDIMKCLERLTPCRPFLKSPRLPRTCCDPLKKVLIDDPTCVCAVYNNDSILKSFNMTKAQAYQLPIKCGMPPPDPNRCKTVNGTGASEIVVKFKEKHNEGNVVVFNFMGVAVHFVTFLT